MPGPIQFGGLASGLDTASIISALLAVEQSTINSLESRKSGEQSKLSLVGTLEGLVKDLQSEAETLSGSGGIFSHSVSLSQEGILGVEVSGNAAAGSHEIRVNALATAARFHSTAVSDSSTDLGTGTLAFDYQGETYEVAVTDPGASSLDDLADRINDEVGDIATATVINTGTESAPSYEIVLTGRSTGSDEEIQNVTVTGLDAQGALSFERLQSAGDAEIELDGITVTRSTNVFSDLLPGYEFTLEQVQDAGDPPVVVSAELDTDATIDKIQTLVDSYNAVVDFVNGQNEFTEDVGTGGPLFGDFLLSRVSSAVYNGLFDVDLDEVQSDESGFSTLSLVGFDVGVDGSITIDRTQMAEKLNEDPTAFENLLTGEVEYPSGSGETVNGAFGKLAASIEDLIEDKTSAGGEPLDGLFAARKEAINDQISLYDDTIEDEEYRLEKLEETLVARFAALEELIGGLQSQQSFLSSISAG